MEDSKKVSPSVKALVLDQSGKYLVIRRSMASETGRGKWDLPGGKLDAGESLEAALLRETVEETGLDIIVVRPVGTALSELPNCTVNFTFYLCRVDGDVPEVTLSDEHTEYRWLTREELLGCDLCSLFVQPVKALISTCASNFECSSDKACRPSENHKGVV